MRRQAAIGHLGAPPAGFSWDEYPYASTLQGGAGATTMAVPIREQRVQGGQLNGLYRSHNMQSGSPFAVVLVP